MLGLDCVQADDGVGIVGECVGRFGDVADAIVVEWRFHGLGHALRDAVVARRDAGIAGHGGAGAELGGAHAAVVAQDILAHREV